MALCRFSHSAADDLAHRQTSEPPEDGEAGCPEDEGGGESATGVPPLKEKHKLAIVLDLPAPLSVNRTRRIDYRSMPALKAWRGKADALFLMQKRKLPSGETINGPFEAIIVINPMSRLDLDNGIKLLIDTAKDYGLIPDDSPKYLRKLTVEFGEAPEGARLTLNRISSCD
jgi:hypothetical protein